MADPTPAYRPGAAPLDGGEFWRLVEDARTVARMQRRPRWVDDGRRDFPAWTPGQPPAGEPYTDSAAARADLPRLASLCAPLTLPPWQPYLPDASTEAPPELLVEIWFPLGSHGEDFLEQLEHIQLADEPAAGGWYDDGEEVDGHYVVALWRAPEGTLLDVARTIAELPGAPAGTFALVTSTESALSGMGRRLALT